MPTDLQSLTELLHQAGALEVIFQRAGAAAGIAAVITLLATLLGFRSRWLRSFAVLTMLAVLALLATGAYGTYNAYQAADAAVASVKPPSVAERQRRVAYAAGRTPLFIALLLSAGPLALGVLGLVIAGRRRWRDDADRPVRLRGLIGMVVVLDLCGFAAEAIAWKMPLPGRDLDETGWKLVELDEAIGEEKFEACLTFDTPIDKASRARKLPVFRDNQQRCAQHFIKADAKDAAANLRRLLEAKWLDDAALRASVQARLDELTKPPPPTAEELEAAKKKALAQEEGAARTQVADVVRTCFGQAVKKTRKLKLSVTLELSVTTSGAVSSVEEKKGALDPAALRKCVIDAAKKLELPNTSGAERRLIVAITLPSSLR